LGTWDSKENSPVALTRRYFFTAACWPALFPKGIRSSVSLKAAGYKSPNEKLNFAAIGSGGQGAATSAPLAYRNIVPCAMSTTAVPPKLSSVP